MRDTALIGMSRLYTYIVQQDTGLAPNPYWGWCTLAVCTPNHQGSRVEVGDWIAGFLSKARDHRFLYAVEVSEILDLDDYFRDPRFVEKKPDLRGNWQERCGDNFYSRREDGTWKQHRNRFHIGEDIKEQDTRHAKVFMGTQFWYLGRSAEIVPTRLKSLVGGRGARVNHDPALVTDFCKWVKKRFSAGVLDFPNDNPDLEASGTEQTTPLCSKAPRKQKAKRHCNR